MFTEGARVVITYLKGLSEQYRHILAKYKVRVYFKDTSTIKSLLMQPKDPIQDFQKTDIMYHWKCPANNCTAEYMGETNRSLKERVSDHRNQTKPPGPLETTTSSQNTQKQNLKILQ